MRIARVVFARLPERGKVKSRLAQDLAEDAAFALYRWLLRIQSRVFAQPADSPHQFSDYVYFAPRRNRLIARTMFAPDLKGLRLRFRAQSDGDLGVRLARACADVLRHHDMAIVWGADIPSLPPGIFSQAVALYPQSVITLARDGGYALLSVAAKTFTPEIFSGIRWSTTYTGADQIRALQRSGIQPVICGRVSDLDRAKDLTRVIRELEQFNRNDDLHDLTQTLEALRQR